MVSKWVSGLNEKLNSSRIKGGFTFTDLGYHLDLSGEELDINAVIYQPECNSPENEHADSHHHVACEVDSHIEHKEFFGQVTKLSERIKQKENNDDCSQKQGSCESTKRDIGEKDHQKEDCEIDDTKVGIVGDYSGGVFHTAIGWMFFAIEDVSALLIFFVCNRIGFAIFLEG